MGAYAFTTPSAGADIRQAFAAARETAVYENGHGGYSGTIAEKHAYRVIDPAPRTMRDAEAIAERMLDEDDPRIRDKWGPAAALRVVDTRFDGWLFFGLASS